MIICVDVIIIKTVHIKTGFFYAVLPEGRKAKDTKI